jgi:uncharacterized membrane protein
MTAEVIVLRLIHVLGAIFWLGSMMFMSLFLMPALAQAGPAAGPVMKGIMDRKFPVYTPIIAGLTMLSGLRLLMIASANFNGGYLSSPVGRTFAIAGTLAIIGFIFGMALVRPAMMKSAALAAQMQSAPDDATRGRIGAELTALRQKGAVGNMIVLVLLVLAAAGMAVARYMG